MNITKIEAVLKDEKRRYVDLRLISDNVTNRMMFRYTAYDVEADIILDFADSKSTLEGFINRLHKELKLSD